MGYYTRYELNADKQIISELRSQNEEAEYALTEDGWSQESCKWYEHETDMKEFSRKHPGHLFKLSGEGEESGDIWEKYFKDGKMQTCKAIITFPPFDETEMK